MSYPNFFTSNLISEINFTMIFKPSNVTMEVNPIILNSINFEIQMTFRSASRVLTPKKGNQKGWITLLWIRFELFISMLIYLLPIMSKHHICRITSSIFYHPPHFKMTPRIINSKIIATYTYLCTSDIYYVTLTFGCLALPPLIHSLFWSWLSGLTHYLTSLDVYVTLTFSCLPLTPLIHSLFWCRLSGLTHYPTSNLRILSLSWTKSQIPVVQNDMKLSQNRLLKLKTAVLQMR